MAKAVIIQDEINRNGLTLYRDMVVEMVGAQCKEKGLYLATVMIGGKKHQVQLKEKDSAYIHEEDLQNLHNNMIKACQPILSSH